MNHDELPSHLLSRLTRRQPRDVASQRRMPADNHHRAMRASHVALAAMTLMSLSGANEIIETPKPAFQTISQNQAL